VLILSLILPNVSYSQNYPSEKSHDHVWEWIYDYECLEYKRNYCKEHVINLDTRQCFKCGVFQKFIDNDHWETLDE